jgi:hypothetical protein
MHHPLGGEKLAGAVLAAFLSIQVALADPLHKSGMEGDYVHEGSGWIFPRQIGSAERVGAPYTIDGSNDVGAEYAMMADGPRQRTVLVEVYYADSAASGAKLASASLAMQRESGTEAAAQLRSQESFVAAQVTGNKLTYESPADSRSTLYFFRTPQWVVTVRSHARSSDTVESKALDEFVRALRWDTLGTDPGDLHRAR